MKTIGLIGGTSWYSTMAFYKHINACVERTLGGHNNAKMVIVNVNMEEIMGNPRQEELLIDAAKQLQTGGADYISLCSNGLHEHIEAIASAVDIPVIHIADSVADAILKAGYNCALLLGARDTMESGFYLSRLEKKGVQVLIPDEEERIFVNDVLYSEATRGIVKPESSARFYEIAQKHMNRGAQCVILGCTEVGMLMQQEHTKMPLFDSTIIQSQTLANLIMA